MPLLWYDDNIGKPLEARLQPAADRYKARLGHPATVCMVHPSTLPSGTIQVAGLRVVAAHYILRNHFQLSAE